MQTSEASQAWSPLIRSKPFLRGVVVTVVTYLVIYGSILVATDGMPYVMDGNESFSSLWHARNLVEFGFHRSLGLADEAFSPHPGAHPYVHTHQGNFPRVFASLIYVLGAQSIESQIVVTTLTVGLISVLLAYLFLARISNPLLATLMALVLITDYLMIGQWLMVTYRVWHLFFVFSSLLCVHAIGSIDRRISLPVGLLNFTCLFYFELIFVAFVALASALYAAYVYAKSPRFTLLTWSVQAAGALLGLGVLAMQLVLYMGWEAFLHDAQLTFVARNMFSDEATLIAHIQDFYDSHRVIFWYNLEDGSRFRSAQHFLASLTYYEFQIHTPFFTYLSLIVAFALFAATLVPFRPFDTRSPSITRLLRGADSVYPVSAALILATVHISHKLVRGESSMLLLAMGGLVGALVVSWMVHCHQTLAATQFSTDLRRVQQRLRIRSSVLALLILVVLAPSLAAHVSSRSTLLGQYSVYFAAFLAVYCALVLQLLLRIWRRRSSGQPAKGHDSKTSGRGAWIVGAIWASLVFAALVFKDGAAYLGTKPEFLKRSGVESLSEWITSAALATMLCVGLIYAWQRSPQARRVMRARWTGVSGAIAGTLLLLTVSLVLSLGWLVFHQNYAVLWEEVMVTILPSWLARGLLAAAAALGIALVLMGPRAIMGRTEERPARNVGMFLLTGFVAYAVVYVLSPGYVFSGYRFRIVPFTAFHNNVLIALALYVLLQGTIFVLARARLTRGTTPLPGRAARTVEPPEFSAFILKRVAGGTGLAVMLFLSASYWIGLQANYLRWFPPDHYAILKKLGEEPYRGASFAANVYAGPIAAFTNQWAYLDEAMIYGWVSEGGGKKVLMASDRYMWFADRGENTSYRRPQYYLCMVMQSFPSVLADLKRQRGDGPGEPGCDTRGLIRLVMDGKGRQIVPRVLMVAIDEEGRKRSGHVRWAIVKLDWPGEEDLEHAAQR